MVNTMSMICTLRRTSDARLEALMSDPETISDYLDGDPDDAVDSGEAYADLDLDKAWHGLHFLLTGTAWEGTPPLDFIVVCIAPGSVPPGFLGSFPVRFLACGLLRVSVVRATQACAQSAKNAEMLCHHECAETHGRHDRDRPPGRKVVERHNVHGEEGDEAERRERAQGGDMTVCAHGTLATT
jgi:hypothetical protein